MIETLVFAMLIASLIVMNSYFKTLQSAIKDVSEELFSLRREIIELQEDLSRKERADALRIVTPPIVEPETQTTPEIQTPELPRQETFVESILKEKTPAYSAPPPPAEELASEQISFDHAASPIEQTEIGDAAAVPEQEKNSSHTTPESGLEQQAQELFKPFVPDFGKEVDYEKYIGENLISKIGIAILVLAIGFFVKYAIDNNWINEVGRVCIGLAAGGILVGVAHWLRRDYKAFSSVLVGGGLAVFYFTIALAYHQFHLFDQTLAFGIMVVITIFAVVLSLLYDRQELAVISMVGGYATPFMVSNGSGNYIALFTYLTLLNTGLLVIAYMRIWRILNLLAFVFTVIIYTSWLFTLNDPRVSTSQNAFIFASVFFLFFFTACLAHNIKEKKKFLPFDFSMLLINSIWYFSVGLYLIDEMNANEYKGLFSAGMAAFHLMASYMLYRNQKADSNILYLLIGITLTFISITAPLQLNGSYITLFWASEAVLLYWLSQRSGMRIIAIGSTLVWCITMLSLAAIWSDVYGGYIQSPMIIIFNKAFVTSVYAAVCSGLIYYLRSKENKQESNTGVGYTFLLPKITFLLAAVAILFIAGSLEIHYQFESRVKGVSVSLIYLMLYLLVFSSAVLYIIRRFTQIDAHGTIRLVVLGILFSVYLIHLPLTYDVYHYLQLAKLSIPYFAAHWFSMGLIGVLIWLLIHDLRQLPDERRSKLRYLAWLIGVAIVVFLSAECYLMAFGLYYTDEPSIEVITRVFVKAVLPILWGICSFAFMWVGMREQFRELRILSLILFSVTLVKLFLFDISNVPMAGKIAAFFCLGILLLVVSFMYQRLKKILIEDGEKKE